MKITAAARNETVIRGKLYQCVTLLGRVLPIIGFHAGQPGAGQCGKFLIQPGDRIRVSENRRAPRGANQFNRLDRREPCSRNVAGAPAAEIASEGVIDRRRISFCDQCPGHMRASDCSATGEPLYLCERDLDPDPGELPDHPLGARLAGVPERREGMLKRRRAGVDEVAKHVQLTSRHLGAQFHSRDDRNPQSLASLVCFPQSLSGIMIGQPKKTDAPLGGQSDQLSGAEGAIRRGTMTMEINDRDR